MKPFSLLVKPVSSQCNIDCSYCFYQGTLQRVFDGDAASSMMSPATAETMIRDFLGLGFPAVSICFQGGEPLLRGIGFYRDIIELEKKYGHAGQAVGNSFQTNGTLITDEWAAFFRQYNMLVGISLDGPQEIHDHYRKTHAGDGTFHQVMAGIDILRKHGVEFNILSMITDHSAGRADAIWRFFKSEGLRFLQFIPCTGPDTPGAIDGSRYAGFLKETFDRWSEEPSPGVSVRLFDDILAWHVDGAHTSCTFQSRCDSYIVVEHNGDVFPCDFAVDPQWRLGTVGRDDLVSMVRSKKREAFSSMKSRVPPECAECRHLRMCSAECTRLRPPAADGKTGRFSLCPGFADFLDYSDSGFIRLRDDIIRNRNTVRPAASKGAVDAGRNDPCPCGSGRKYKHCCGLSIH